MVRIYKYTTKTKYLCGFSRKGVNSCNMEHGKVVDGSNTLLQDSGCIHCSDPMSTSCTFDADKIGCTTNTK